MSLFSNIILGKVLGLLNANLGETGSAPITRDDLPRHVNPMWKGSSLVDSGDVVYFNYQGSTRYAFVVSARGGQGIYVTPKNRRVMSCFLVDGADPELIDSVVGGLYKTKEGKKLPIRKILQYKSVIKSFNNLFGSENFRTFRLDRISGSINQVVLNIKPSE